MCFEQYSAKDFAKSFEEISKLARVTSKEKDEIMEEKYFVIRKIDDCGNKEIDCTAYTKKEIEEELNDLCGNIKILDKYDINCNYLSDMNDNEILIIKGEIIQPKQKKTVTWEV